MVKKLVKKSDLVLLFELASGWLIEDYLWERATRGWPWARIADEMNSKIKKLLSSKVLERGLFRVSHSNLNRWYGMFGIKSIVKRGPKPKAPDKTVRGRISLTVYTKKRGKRNVKKN